jgi:hypothetical protein
MLSVRTSRYSSLIDLYFQLSIDFRIMESGGCSFSSVLIPAGSVTFARIDPLFSLRRGSVAFPPF